MRTNRLLPPPPGAGLLALACLLWSGSLIGRCDAAPARPNVIVILADDLGWPDLGIQGAKDLRTPNIDSLATNGVRFLNAYVVSPICSPSRAGLMAGRYPQRFGHEVNPGPDLETNAVFGLPLTEPTAGDRMKSLGYATGWIGKSHLGGAPQYWPLQRGFDEFFGFLEGHHDYTYPYELTPGDPIRRGSTPVLVTNYLTTEFATECASYIDRHASEPFFLYAPFNAVHYPMQAPSNYLARFNPADYGGFTPRYTNAAMLAVLDDAVGTILDRLRANHIESNTMVFFTSDNGAPTPGRVDQNGSVNTPLRGYKGNLYEGGIRVPFLLQWKGTIPTGTVDALVSTLDILPTAVAATGTTIPPAWQLDGANLLPFLTGQSASPPHPNLLWRLDTRGGDDILPGPRAIRSGNWKGVKPSVDANWELYDLGSDISESRDLAEDRPDVLRELIETFEAWDQELTTPRWDFNTLYYVTPRFVREDQRIGGTNVSYVAPDWTPDGRRVAFRDQDLRLWSADLDPLTGLLLVPSGQQTPVDTGAAALPYPLESIRWGLSSNGPALFYSKDDGTGHLQLWRATPQGAAFGRQPLTFATTLSSFGVRPSIDSTSAAVRLLFNAGDPSGTPAVVWSLETAAGSATPLFRPLPGGLNGSWIPGVADVVYSGYPLAQSTIPQVERFTTGTAVRQVVTVDPGLKTDVCSLRAPELDGELLYAAIVDLTRIVIYRAPLNFSSPSSPFTNILSLAFPDDAPQRYIAGLSPLPGSAGYNGVSYLAFATYSTSDPSTAADSGIWLLGLGPDLSHPIFRRLDADPLATGGPAVPGNRAPHLVAGERGLFCYYSRAQGTGPVELRLARTGISTPDHPGPADGFAQLRFSRSFTAGTNDPAGRAMNNTETTLLAAHNGWLFAGQGSLGVAAYPDDISNPPPTWSGAQILVKKSADEPWRVDYTSGLDPFPFHLRVEALTELRITTDSNGDPANVPGGAILVSSMRDIGETGARAASTRMRDDLTGIWKESHVTTAGEEAYPVSFASHRDGKVHRVFTGLSNGQIHRGAYNSASRNLAWVTNAEFSGGGPVMGLAEANGLLYATSGLRQDASNAPVSGGLLVRDDASDSWRLVYRWPYPPDLYARSNEV